MRGPTSLDADVAEKLKAASHRSGQSFHETVNETLRCGLNRKPVRNSKRFEVRDIGFRLGAHFESTSRFLEGTELRVRYPLDLNAPQE